MRIILRLVLALLALANSNISSAETIQGRVVSIADGDKVTILDAKRIQHRIRLAGIDSPERAQSFGDRSKTSLSALVFNRQVEVIGYNDDRYGNRIGKMMVAEPGCTAPACPKTLDAGLQQIAAGMAWWYRTYAEEQAPKDREDYAIAEFQAKIHRLGLWSDTNPVPPWEWRRSRFPSSPK